MEEDKSFAGGKLSRSAAFVLSNGAAITTPVQITLQHSGSFEYKPGDEISLATEDELQPILLCRILDIESITTEQGKPPSVRITLEKA